MNFKEKFARRLRRHEKDPDYLFEGLQFDILEQIVTTMESHKVTNSKLAKKLKCSNAYITKLLRGNQNLTIRKLFDIGWVLGQRLQVKYLDLDIATDSASMMVSNREPQATNVINMGQSSSSSTTPGKTYFLNGGLPSPALNLEDVRMVKANTSTETKDSSHEFLRAS